VLRVSKSWCSVKEIGVSCRLVPANIVTVGWCLQDFIKELFCGFLPFGFPRKISVYCDSVDMFSSLHC
jgi:hypothetical protein